MNSRKMRAGIGKKLLFAVVITAVLFIAQKSFSQLQFEWVRNYPNYQDHSAAIFREGYFSNTNAIKIFFNAVLEIQNFSKLILNNKFI